MDIYRMHVLIIGFAQVFKTRTSITQLYHLRLAKLEGEAAGDQALIDFFKLAVSTEDPTFKCVRAHRIGDSLHLLVNFIDERRGGALSKKKEKEEEEEKADDDGEATLNWPESLEDPDGGEARL